MAAGVGYVQIRPTTTPKPPPQQAAAKTNNPLVDQYKLYNAAVQQQAGDYGSIMQGYKDLLARTAGGKYTPTTSPYQPSQAQTSAISNLGELSQSGGYTPEGIANIRERGISPIRSIYASANRDVDRQRALQGGYSPNYGAVKAKMARELSDSIGNQVTNVNAELAQNVAQNRIAAASPYASAAANESQMRNQSGMQNADIINQAQQFNLSQLPQQSMQALSGMQGLYGTTPAMASLFGNQVLQGAQLQQQINQQPQNPVAVQPVKKPVKDKFGAIIGYQ